MSLDGCKNRSDLSFEQGPIRPPSEAKSLLVRVTRNCSWNKCGFCRTYKGKRFSLRSVEELKEDIAAIKKTYDEIKALSWQLGFSGEVNEKVLQQVYYDSRGRSSSYMNVAMWLYYGEGSVFLQDGNNVIMKTKDLEEILLLLTKTFPEIQRITTYARSKTIAKRKSVEELKALREAGLNRIHIGLESGSDEVLTLIRKGVTAAEHIEAGRKVKEAGLSLSEYVIPGLGGEKLSQEHALETARVLNAINPDFIRLRTLRVVEGAGLDEAVAAEEFSPLGDEEIVREIRLMIEHLEGITSYIVSDHILNLLEEVEGRFPDDKPAMLAVIDRFLQMSAEDRRNFCFGRRATLYRTLDDMSNSATYNRVESAVQQIIQSGEDSLEEVIGEFTKQFI
jgi:histone acetyltransferase (RNA polymerase elongator complex component)